jgi:hypothetical protein
MGAMKRSGAGIFCMRLSTLHVTTITLALGNFCFALERSAAREPQLDLLLELAFIVFA